jgi:hypothetical protein
MILRKIMVPLFVYLFFMGQTVTTHANCIEDWLNGNPLQGNLSSQQATDVNILFDWLQQVLPDILFPPAVSILAGPVSYRYYSGTNTFLIALQSQELKLTYVGPLSNYCILDLGTVAQWITLVPISGQISGVINENEYDSSQSTTTVTINRMCKNLDDFLVLQSQIADTPQGAVAMMILAMAIYQQDPITGRMCLTAASTDPLVSPSTAAGSYNGEIITNSSISRLTENLETYPLLPFIYYRGAAPSHSYTPSAPPYVLDMYTNPYSYSQGGDGLVRVKLFVETLGADSARPATVKNVGGIYKITEFSSLYLAYKPIG